MVPMESTSWESVTNWYDKSVGVEGHYYHQHVIMPRLKELIKFKDKDHLLDFACGQGVLARQIPKKIAYTGIDLSSSLIKAAKKHDRNEKHHYQTHDATEPLPFEAGSFSHATIVLALQNISEPEKVIQSAYKALKPGGRFYIILNHPCFRVPRQSSWGVDEAKKLQYRRIDRYMSQLKIPIQMTPSKGKKSTQTLSFHRPLSFYSKALKDAGFSTLLIEEWCSDKVSTGKMAKAENRAREEIPLFLCFVAEKSMN